MCFLDSVLGSDDGFLYLGTQCGVLLHQLVVVLYRLKGSYQSFGFLLIYRLQIPFAGALVGGVGIAHIKGALPYAERLVLHAESLVMSFLVQIILCVALS